MSRFFIDRPIFAWVIALFIMVMGATAITQLPIAQYPPVAPPAIVVSAAYPGASARTMEESVTTNGHQQPAGMPGGSMDGGTKEPAGGRGGTVKEQGKMPAGSMGA